jgi:hypothetical protein
MSSVVRALKTGIGLLVPVLVLSACRSTLAPADRMPIVPPLEYRVWWDATRTCVGMPDADFEMIRWWSATDVLAENLMSGLWVAPHDIYIRPDKLDAEGVIRHEMVHDLLQRGDHESSFYGLCVGRDPRACLELPSAY